jgi:hypothetical protein
MRTLPNFHSESTELLNNAGLAGRFQQTVEDGLLFEDWKKFCQWLKLELRGLASSLHDWPAPWIYEDAECISVNIESGSSWTHKGEHAVCLYFDIWPETLYASVGLWASEEWPHHNVFCSFIEQYRPDGFTDCDDEGSPSIEYPFWRDLRLEEFQTNGAFEWEGFVRAIGQAFESLAAIRPAIDQFLADQNDEPEPAVRPIGKALILDLEGMDEVVEVGLILAAYNLETKEIAGVLESYTGLRDPGPSVKLPQKFTPKMVRGKKLDRAKVAGFIAQADVIISHNNSFDRPLFEKLFPASKSAHWLCSLNDLPWVEFGFEERGLEYLCGRHRIRNRDPHRALADAEALLRLLAQEQGSLSYFSKLLHSEDIVQAGTSAALARAK